MAFQARHGGILPFAVALKTLFEGEEFRDEGQVCKQSHSEIQSRCASVPRSGSECGRSLESFPGSRFLPYQELITES